MLLVGCTRRRPLVCRTAGLAVPRHTGGRCPRTNHLPPEASVHVRLHPGCSQQDTDVRQPPSQQVSYSFSVFRTPINFEILYRFPFDIFLSCITFSSLDLHVWRVSSHTDFLISHLCHQERAPGCIQGVVHVVLPAGHTDHPSGGSRGQLAHGIHRSRHSRPWPSHASRETVGALESEGRHSGLWVCQHTILAVVTSPNSLWIEYNFKGVSIVTLNIS